MGAVVASGRATRRWPSCTGPVALASIGLFALTAGRPAEAACTPDSGSAASGGITAICSGPTLNQGGATPGNTDGLTNGYGTGAEADITVNVLSGASVTGSDRGLYFKGATVTNALGATISGGINGVRAETSPLDITNAGTITGGMIGAYADNNVTVRNTGTINGQFGVLANAGVADVINSGTITGTFGVGVYGGFGVAVTNSGTISNSNYGIFALGSGSYVTNSGTISGGIEAIRFAGSDNTLTLEPGSVINGSVNGTGNDTFQFGGSGSASFDMTQFGSQYTGFGIINKIGSSTWTLTGPSGGFMGPVNINQGTLSISSLDGPVFSSLGDGLLTMGGGTLRTTATGTLVNDIVFAAGTTSTLAAATGTTMTIGSPVSNFKLDTGATAVFGSPTDNGVILFSSLFFPDVEPTSAVVVAGGTLQDNQNNLWQLLGFTGSVTVNAGATIDYNDSTFQIINNLSGAGTVATGPTGTNQLVLDSLPGRTNLFSGMITGSHPVQIAAGTYIFSGNNTYTGDTFICYCSTLQIGNGGTSGSIMSSTVFNGGELIFNRSDTYVFGGMIVDFGPDPGRVTQAGTGTTVFTADNTYTGGTTISAGTLQLGNGGTTGSILGDVVNNGTLAFNRSDAFAFDGNISGSGGLAQLGPGDTTLGGNNSFGGPIDVLGGRLIAGTATAFGTPGAVSVAAGATINLNNFNATFGSLSGAGTAALGSATLTTGGSNASTTFSGAITGSGGLVKTGTGNFNLTGISSYTGPTAVNGGMLSVNGSIANSAVTVSAGGTLGGNGTVGGTTLNGGTLSPGNSIGTLNVQGNLVFTAASTYLVEVDNSAADRTNVTGTATLGGATVQATFAPGAYVERQYTIVNATGGVIGTFGSQVNSNLPTNFKTSLSTDAQNAYLNLTLDFTPPPPPPPPPGPTPNPTPTPTPAPTPPRNSGLNVNQTNVANALTGFFDRTGGIPLAFGALSPAGLTLVSGETAVATQQATFDSMNLFIGLISDPFVAGRADGLAGGVSPSAFAEDADAQAYAATGRSKRSATERDAYALITKAVPPPAPLFAQRWSVWASGFGGSQTTDGNGGLGSNRTTSRTAAGAVGADYRVSPTTLAGFAMAGGGTSFSVNGFGGGRSDLFQAGGYLRHNVGSAYLTAAAAYGWQDVTTERTLLGAGPTQLHAQFNVNSWSGRVEAGSRYALPFAGPSAGITPYAAGQFTTYDAPAYSEQVLARAGLFALNYQSASVTASRSEVGLRSDASWAFNDALFTLRGRAAWAHNFDTGRALTATFQSLPGTSFVVNGAAPARDAALTTAAAEIKFSTGIALAAIFEGEFSDVTRSYAGKGVVRYAW